MNLRQIEVFRAFMLTGTIGDAARLLGVSAPAVSAMLHHIQDRGGIRLFEPVKGRLLPTPEARTLFAEAERAWKSVERVQRLSQDLAAGRTATLRIAGTTSLGVHLIPEAVRQVATAFPTLSVRVELFTPTLLVECLLADEADVGVASCRIDHPGLVARTVGTAPIVCAMPLGHRLAEREAVAIADLAETPLVTHSAELPEGALVAEAFRAAGIVPQARVQVRSGQSACWFVRSGAGVALLDAATVAGGAFADLAIRPVTPPLALPVMTLRTPLRTPAGPALAFIRRVASLCARTFPRS